MLIVEDLSSKELSGHKRRLQFYLVDTHHHIGEDEDGHRNLNVRGSFDFFRSIWILLTQRYQKMGDLEDHFKPKYKIIDNSPPDPLKFLASNSFYNDTWIFDQFIAFPFNDIFREPTGQDSVKAKYGSSNSRLSTMMANPNSGCRLIGYCRLDPHDGQFALQELDRAISTLGLKGIKLHPISDKWNSKEYFTDDFGFVIKILQSAIKYNVPVIFDCRFNSTLSWIFEAVKQVRKEFLENNFAESYINTRLKVIIAHIGFLWQTDELVFKALSHPNIYGDLTGQFSTKTKELMENLKRRVQCENKDVPEWQKATYWSTKIMMGTDYNYFDAFHIVDQLLYFFSEGFSDLIQGNLSILQNIFSENIMRLLPTEIPIYKGNVNHEKEKKQISQINCLKLSEQAYIQFIQKIFNALTEKLVKGYPFYFRMEPIFKYYDHFSNSASFISQNFQPSQNSLENQYNFFFQWKESPFTIAGMKFHNLNQFVLYLFNKDARNIVPFDIIREIFYENECYEADVKLEKIDEFIATSVEKILIKLGIKNDGK